MPSDEMKGRKVRNDAEMVNLVSKHVPFHREKPNYVEMAIKS